MTAATRAGRPRHRRPAHPRGPGHPVRRLPRPRPAVGGAGLAGQRPHRALPPARSSPASRPWSRTGTAPSGPSPTTGSAPRPTPPTSCCGSTRSDPTGRPPTAARASIEVERLHLAARPGPQGPVRDRRTSDARPAAHRRRLRHRVGGPRQGRHVLDRRGVRPVPAARRRPTAGCCRHRCPSPTASRRRTPTSPPARRPGSPPAAASRRWPRSADGRYLYPIVEGAFLDDADQRRRWRLRVRHADAARTPGAPGPTRSTRPPNVVGDAFTVRKDRLLLIERDNFDGPAAVTKRLYEVDLRDRRRRRVRREDAGRRPAARSPTPTTSALATSPGAYGVADPFAFPMVSVEIVVELRDGRLLVANDNNYPGDDARVPGTPDDTEMIVIDLRQARAPSAARRAGHRPPRLQRHPARAHAGVVRAGHPGLRRLHRARPGLDQGRRAGRPARERDRRHHRRRHQARVRRPPDDQDDRRRRGHRLVHRGLHPRRAQDAARRRSGSPASGRDNTAFDGLYAVPTLDEVLDLARHSRTCDGGPVGVYPETKHPTYFDDARPVAGGAAARRRSPPTATTPRRPRLPAELRDRPTCASSTRSPTSRSSS